MKIIKDKVISYVEVYRNCRMFYITISLVNLKIDNILNYFLIFDYDTLRHFHFNSLY